MNKIRIFEVGLRDGLQNEKIDFPIQQRQELLTQLIDAGLTHLEIGSFVSPKWVPAMACSEDFVSYSLSELSKGKFPATILFSALIPNEKGLDTALRLGVKEIAIFASCSETFSQKNTNCSIDESFLRLEKVSRMAIQHMIKVRGYLSTCFGCPFEGPVDINQVLTNVDRMKKMGVYEISLGDTIGLASAGDVDKLLSQLLKSHPSDFFAGHFHDTRGQALVNILKAYEFGLRVFDSSIGGLGGCPYAPGATGNVATEDVIYLFNSLGVSTGVDLNKLVNINHWLSQKMNKRLPSKVSLANHFSNQDLSKNRGSCFK